MTPQKRIMWHSTSVTQSPRNKSEEKESPSRTERWPGGNDRDGKTREELRVVASALWKWWSTEPRLNKEGEMTRKKNREGGRIDHGVDRPSKPACSLFPYLWFMSVTASTLTSYIHEACGSAYLRLLEPTSFSWFKDFTLKLFLFFSASSLSSSLCHIIISIQTCSPFSHLQKK